MGPVDGSVLWYSRRGFPGWIRFIYDKSFLADLFSVSNPTWRRGCESWGSMASAALQGGVRSSAGQDRRPWGCSRRCILVLEKRLSVFLRFIYDEKYGCTSI